jgi:hypothetical protein
MNGRSALFIVGVAFALVTVARGGHEQPVYPSYYPHEIELTAVAPERAAELLRPGKIQVYLGSAPRFADPPPTTIESISSLGAFLVVRTNPSSPVARDSASACGTLDIVARDFAGKSDALISHPYPVTPFHGDYLHHADLVEAEKARIGNGTADAGAQKLRVKTSSSFAELLVRPEWRADSAEWDLEVAEVDAARLVASTRVSMNGWTGPAWLRTGWFHASLLLDPPAGDDRQRSAELRRRLQEAKFSDLSERVNLERSLVKTLTASCHARVVGYKVKRESFSTIFTAGVENIGYDVLEGFNSPMFVRTVKLKDFPWNGWLAVGIDAAPKAAWNPIAGFTDPFGQLMWSAIGDTASIPSPYEAAWMLNRISDVQAGRP